MERNYLVGTICPFCNTYHDVLVNEDAFILWQCGSLIQDVMPDLTPTEREQLISHLCPKCQKEIFGK